MKKIFRLFAAFAATTFAFSCMEEANPEAPVTGNGGTSYEGPMVTLTFAVDELTKTSYDKENGHQWSEGDKIKIIWGAEDNAYVVADVVNGAVTATVGDVETYYAVYPETAEYRFDKPSDSDEAKFSVRIPRSQDGTFKTANLMSAQTTREGRSFDFKNLTHIIKFELNEGHGYDVIEFCANSETIITGRYFVDVTGEDVSMVYNSTGGTNSKYITVNKLNGKSGVFYVGLLPGADMSTGIVLRAKKKEEDYKYFALSTTPLITTRSAITPMGALDGYLRENVWYITENGTGDGSKDNPAGISKFIELMNKITLADGVKTKTMHQWRLCDAEINFAAGTYNIPAANGNATFEPNGLTEHTSVTIRGEEGTVLTTVAAQNVRIFRFNNAGKTGTVTFENITFQGTGETGVSSVGVGTYCSGDTEGTFNYNNCTFTGFNNTGGSSGSVILSAGAGERVLNFTGCTFENNVTANNGIIANTAAKTTINLSKCTFQNNTANCGAALYTNAGTTKCEGCKFTSNTASSGGAAYLTGGTASLKDCEFNSNTVTGNGGAIHMKSQVTVNVENSEFVSNSAKYGGAISNEISTLVVAGCTFNENSVSMQGGAICSYDAALAATNSKYPVISEGKKAYLYVYDSAFNSNKSSNQGAAIKVQGSGYLAIVNSSYTGNVCTNQGGVVRLRCGDATDPKDGVTAWMINVTSNNPKASSKNQYSLFNQTSTAYVYNSIFFNYGSAGTPSTSYYSTINGSELWKADGTKSETAVTFADQIGAFANGVFPVTAESVAATSGMTSAELSALATDITAAMPLFDATKLTVDQKGNSRVGKTVMGAYVAQ